MKTKTILTSLSFAVALTTTRAADLTPAETKAIAEEAYIYGLPIVMNYAVMHEYAVDKSGPQFKAPFNQIKNEARVFTYEDTAIITPNSDTPYSFNWLDLRAEPMVLSVPAVEKERYYAVMLCDGNTYNFGYIGSRATGSDAGDYMVVGTDWKGEKPAGIKKVFTSTTPFAVAGYRTQLFNAEDMPNVVKVQAGYKAQPLSSFLKQPAPPEKEIRAKLAKIGIGSDKPFDFKSLPAEQKEAFMLGMKSGDEQVDKFLASGVKIINGWGVGSFFGDRDFFKANWLKRAAAAKGGLYGNDAVEATYPFTRVDGTGEKLDGSKHNYTITFPAGQLPPVNAFWSVTMYDGKSQFLIKNPINRYLINSPMLPNMKKNADGSLTLYIQKNSPGADKEANWLPAPNDKIYLVLRLYWPKPAPPSILPAGEGTWKPPGVKKV